MDGRTGKQLLEIFHKLAKDFNEEDQAWLWKDTALKAYRINLDDPKLKMIKKNTPKERTFIMIKPDGVQRGLVG